MKIYRQKTIATQVSKLLRAGSQIWPEECCGVGSYFEKDIHLLKNNSNKPSQAFEFEMPSFDFDYIFHSHCNCRNYSVSESDIKGLSFFKKDWVILFYDNKRNPRLFLEIPFDEKKRLSYPLENRFFIYRFFDCASLVRSYFYQNYDFLISDYKRPDYGFWNEDSGNVFFNVNERSFIFKEGFDCSSIKKGKTVFLISTRGNNTVDHCAIYVGDNLIFHHLEGLFPCYSHLNEWKDRIKGTYLFAK